MPRLIRGALDSAGVGGQDRVSTGVDLIGDIAIVRLASFRPREKKRIGEAILGQVKNAKAVYEQEGGIEGELRLRSLKHIAGEKRTLTTHRENGCAFKVDVARCYFSPRLSTERLRVAGLVRKGDRMLNMFAGVGPFSIEAAKIGAARVTSCELNHYACELHRENDKINKVEKLVSVVEGDASDLRPDGRFDRVVMPHPSKADEFLPSALALAGKGATIHYYRHLPGRDEPEALRMLAEELSELLPKGARYRARRVRVVGPRWVETVADIRLEP